MAGIYERELRYHESCPERAAPAAYRLETRDGGGVAILFGVLCGLSLLCAIHETRTAEQKEKAKKRTSSGQDQDTMLTDGDMLREIYRLVEKASAKDARMERNRASLPDDAEKLATVVARTRVRHARTRRQPPPSV